LYFNVEKLQRGKYIFPVFSTCEQDTTNFQLQHFIWNLFLPMLYFECSFSYFESPRTWNLNILSKHRVDLSNSTSGANFYCTAQTLQDPLFGGSIVEVELWSFGAFARATWNVCCCDLRLLLGKKYFALAEVNVRWQGENQLEHRSRMINAARLNAQFSLHIRLTPCPVARRRTLTLMSVDPLSALIKYIKQALQTPFWLPRPANSN
jgi:hypothetical protein